MKRKGAIFFLAAFGYVMFSMAGEKNPAGVVDYLKAYIYQHEKIIDGEIATAAYIASAEHNGLQLLANPSSEIQGLVKDVLQKDYAENRTEYQARIHIANAESLGPGKAWSLEKVQNHLWSRFFDDPRWLRRIFEKIITEAEARSLKISLGPIPSPEPLRTNIDEIRRVCEKLDSYHAPDSPACAGNPVLAMRAAQGEDPVLVAAIFKQGWEPGSSLDPALVAEKLQKEGWLLGNEGAR